MVCTLSYWISLYVYFSIVSSVTEDKKTKRQLYTTPIDHTHSHIRPEPLQTKVSPISDNIPHYLLYYKERDKERSRRGERAKMEGWTSSCKTSWTCQEPTITR